MENLQIAKYLLKLEKSAYKAVKKQKLKVSDKGSSGHDLLTSYDMFLEDFIVKKLNKDFPGIDIVSEESFVNMQPRGTYFIIDPLDGTINFANGLDDRWGIQIAYVEKDVTKASAIFMPNVAQYIAADKEGCYKNGKRFFVNEKDLKHCLLLVDARIPETCTLYNLLGKDVMNFRKSGAACIDHTFAAEGKFGIYIQCICKPWDYIPGQIICKEAGCAIKKVGKFHIVCCSQKVLNKVLKILKENNFVFE